MKKPLIGTAVVVIWNIACAFALGAQANLPAPPRTISQCSSGLTGGGPECAPDRRLLIDLRLHGKGATADIAPVIDIGAIAGGAFALNPARSTIADSVAFAIVEITRDADGAYKIDERMTGSLVTPANDCHTASIGRLPDVSFGAHLALQTAQFVRCAQNNRANYRRE